MQFSQWRRRSSLTSCSRCRIRQLVCSRVLENLISACLSFSTLSSNALLYLSMSGTTSVRWSADVDDPLTSLQLCSSLPRNILCSSFSESFKEHFILHEPPPDLLSQHVWSLAFSISVVGPMTCTHCQGIREYCYFMTFLEDFLVLGVLMYTVH